MNSCASKKDILYLQDAYNYPETPINYTNALLQPNDVLRIMVSAAMPEMAVPYNRPMVQGGAMNAQMLSLDGYLVSEDLTINFPVLGTIDVGNKTTEQLAAHIKQLLETGNHLKDPVVDVRLVNAKFSVLGEVNNPGTYVFTEPNINIMQALGYAGDLNINGRRNDIIVIRELEGVRRISHIDLTNSAYLDSEFNFIKPNDVIIVNPNEPKVKSSGFIGNPATLLSVISIIISTTILLTR
jgi:polysaccharide export outer membrane protein